jgi:hypothetical protein
MNVRLFQYKMDVRYYCIILRDKNKWNEKNYCLLFEVMVAKSDQFGEFVFRASTALSSICVKVHAHTHTQALITYTKHILTHLLIFC